MQIITLVLVSILILVNLPFALMTYSGLYKKFKMLSKGGNMHK